MFRPISIRIKNLTSHKDTYYEFKQGVPQLIFGKNLDDPGQKGNGSGKSGFIEALSIAITGSSIRTKFLRRLITRGQDELSVELLLNNIKNNKDLQIIRKIHKSEHKSQECTVKYGNDQIVLSKVTDYTGWILDEIGISEEDFKTYYLITMENYKPFFSLTDASKKVIVNRFSGANKIDSVDDFIKSDSLLKGKEIYEVEKKLSNEEAKRGVYVEQIEALKKRISPEVKFEQTSSKERLIKTIEEGLIQREEKLLVEIGKEEKIKLDILTLSLEIDEEWKKKKDSQLIVENGKLGKYKESKVNITLNYNVKYTDLKNKVTAQELLITKQKEILKVSQQEVSSMENLVASSIDCPKCNHTFVLHADDFNVNEAITVSLPKLESIVTGNKLKLKELENGLTILDANKKVIQEEEEIEETELNQLIKTLELVIENIRTELQIFNSKKNELFSKREELKTQENTVKRLETEYTEKLQEIEKLKEEIISINANNNADTKEIDEKIISSENETKLLTTKLFNVRKEKQDIDSWLINFKNFKSELANKSIKNIQDYTTLFLKSFGTNLSVKLEGYKVGAGGKIKEEIDTIILRDGFPIDTYDTFSRGERTRIDFANIIGQQELINLNSKNGLDLLIVDEILDSFDSLGIELIMKSILDLGKTIFIVSQIEVNSMKDNTLVIVKENKESKVVSN